MEDLDRIERKLKKLQEWCEMLVVKVKENYEQHLYQETYDLVVNQIDINLADIDKIRVDHVHGIDISSRVKTLKHEFNFLTRVYRDLSKLYKEPFRPRRTWRHRRILQRI